MTIFPAKSQLQSDPGLVSAILLQTLTLKECYDKRNKTQEAIATAQFLVGKSIETLHKYENMTLSYLMNASNAVQNLHQIKEIAELVAVKIPANLTNLAKDIPKNGKGTALSAFASDYHKQVYKDIAELYGHINMLVTGTKFSIGNSKDTDDKKNVNLLNAAERYYIAQTVLDKLKSINRQIWYLNWQIKTMTWSNFFWHIDPKAWCSFYGGKEIAERIIKDWKGLSKKY